MLYPLYKRQIMAPGHWCYSALFELGLALGQYFWSTNFLIKKVFKNFSKTFLKQILKEKITTRSEIIGLENRKINKQKTILKIDAK